MGFISILASVCKGGGMCCSKREKELSWFDSRRGGLYGIGYASHILCGVVFSSKCKKSTSK